MQPKVDKKVYSFNDVEKAKSSMRYRFFSHLPIKASKNSFGKAEKPSFEKLKEGLLEVSYHKPQNDFGINLFIDEYQKGKKSFDELIHEFYQKLLDERKELKDRFTTTRLSIEYYPDSYTAKHFEPHREWLMQEVAKLKNKMPIIASDPKVEETISDIDVPFFWMALPLLGHKGEVPHGDTKTANTYIDQALMALSKDRKKLDKETYEKINIPKDSVPAQIDLFDMQSPFLALLIHRDNKLIKTLSFLNNSGRTLVRYNFRYDFFQPTVPDSFSDNNDMYEKAFLALLSSVDVYTKRESLYHRAVEQGMFDNYFYYGPIFPRTFKIFADYIINGIAYKQIEEEYYDLFKRLKYKASNILYEVESLYGGDCNLLSKEDVKEVFNSPIEEDPQNPAPKPEAESKSATLKLKKGIKDLAVVIDAMIKANWFDNKNDIEVYRAFQQIFPDSQPKHSNAHDFLKNCNPKDLEAIFDDLKSVSQERRKILIDNRNKRRNKSED